MESFRKKFHERQWRASVTWLCLDRGLGSLMRALFACNKWRHIMIDLVESRSSLRIKGKRNDRAIPLCPLASLDRKQSYGDVRLHLPFGHVMVPSKSQQRNESLGKWTRRTLFLFWTPIRW